MTLTSTAEFSLGRRRTPRSLRETQTPRWVVTNRPWPGCRVFNRGFRPERLDEAGEDSSTAHDG
jgi:hypothetical protein